MSEPRKRIKLHAVHAEAKPASPPYSLVKKAILLFRPSSEPEIIWKTKVLWRANAIAWLKARERMGDKHVLKGHAVSWGRAGEPDVGQLRSPRRLGERT